MFLNPQSPIFKTPIPNSKSPIACYITNKGFPLLVLFCFFLSKCPKFPAGEYHMPMRLFTNTVNVILKSFKIQNTENCIFYDWKHYLKPLGFAGIVKPGEGKGHLIN